MGFLEDRIEKTKQQIINYEGAIDAILIHGMASYDLDTGQTRQKVTHQNAKEMQDVLNNLYDRLDILNARTGISRSVVIGRPGF